VIDLKDRDAQALKGLSYRRVLRESNNEVRPQRDDLLNIYIVESPNLLTLLRLGRKATIVSYAHHSISEPHIEENLGDTWS
jgi:hypothetical protein